MGSFSDYLQKRQLKKENKQYYKILNTTRYRDIFGNKLDASEYQIKFLLRNFDIETLIEMFKMRPAYIQFDGYDIELFFAHSLTADDMCIVFNNIDFENNGDDEQAAIIIDKYGKLIDQYIGNIKYDYNREDQIVLI